MRENEKNELIAEMEGVLLKVRPKYRLYDVSFNNGVKNCIEIVNRCKSDESLVQALQEYKDAVDKTITEMNKTNDSFMNKFLAISVKMVKLYESLKGAEVN